VSPVVSDAATITNDAGVEVGKQKMNGRVGEMVIPVSPDTPLNVRATAFVGGGCTIHPTANVGTAIVLTPEARTTLVADI
jgi:hypothetical protein